MSLYRIFILSRKALWLFAACWAGSAWAQASDLRVPSGFRTIQSAIEAASDGDRILVAKGVYKGIGNVNLDMMGKAITIQGAGYLSTVIDAEGMSRGFVFHSGETSASVVRNLSIRRAFSQTGGAMAIVDSSPSIIRCAIDDSYAREGGAISIEGGSPSIIATYFRRNRAQMGGGAIAAVQSSPTISGCTFDGNESSTAGGAISMKGGSLFIVSCGFRDNVAHQGGAGLQAIGGDVAFANCTFSVNVTGTNGGAVDLSSGATSAFSNCTLAANLSRSGPGAIRLASDSNATISNSILWNNGTNSVSGQANVRYSCINGGAPGDGNTSEDPKLVDALNHDLHIRIGSSCIDKGDSNSIVIPQDQDGRNRSIGSGPDMGAFEFPIVRPTAEVTAGTNNVFAVPHDGNPETSVTTISISGKGFDWLLAPLSYQWMIDESVVGTTETLTMEMEPGERVLNLQVRDADGGIENSKVVVNVLPEANSKPVASAGRDLTFIAASATTRVVIRGHGYDADGDPITYLWSTGATTPDLTLDLPAGYYTYVLCVTDSYGEKDFSTVHVTVLDGAPPQISVKGGDSVTHEVFTPWSDPGASATDGVDGALSVKVYGTVNTTKLGTYVLTYAATDSSGNTNSTRRTVQVVDTTPPNILAVGLLNMQIECLQGYTEPGATAVDNYDGVVEITTSGTVSSTTGTYTVTYTATDSSGNVSTVVRTVNVTDSTAPVITLNGLAPMTIECGVGYREPGATATDACDGTSLPVTITGSVISRVGTYVITYSATDSAGNTATLTRTVNVQDTIAPVIKLNGPQKLQVDCVRGYDEQGATAQDSCEGQVPVTITGTVPSAPGTYTVTYTASDSSGNTSSITRQVQIVNRTPPNVIYFNPSPSTINNPTGTMKKINLQYGFAKSCDVLLWTVTCASSDPDSGAFVGDLPGDIEKIDDNNFNIRAETRPGKTRTYTFTLTVTDASGNVTVRTCTVVVQ